MKYKGGKNGSGVYQRIVSLIPPHRVYIELFLGSGSILRRKRPAEKSIAFELDRKAIAEIATHIPPEHFEPWDLNAEWKSPADPLPGCGGTSIGFYDPNSDSKTNLEIFNSDAIDALRNRFTASSLFWGWNDPGEVVIYADPPYPNAVRSTPGRIYEFELMAEIEHREMLELLLTVPCKVILSGYDNDLYNLMLAGWRKVEIPTTNRAGTRVIETVWLNFPEPFELHDYQYIGENFRDRWRIEKRRRNWIGQLRTMSAADRSALFNDIAELRSEYQAAEVDRQKEFTKKAISRARAAEKAAGPGKVKPAAKMIEPELFK